MALEASKKRQLPHQQPQPTTARIDPLQHLNVDVLNVVFNHLDVDDIVRCDRVSKHWQEFASDWMVQFGVANKLRPWVPRRALIDADVHLSHTQIKNYGWQPLVSSAKQTLISLDDVIGWYCGDWIRDVHTTLNKSGQLLLNFDVPYAVAYTAAFDFCTMRKLWHRQHKWDEDRTWEVALRLGDSRAYCNLRQEPGNGYDLAAFDIWTGSMIYRLPLPEKCEEISCTLPLLRIELRDRVELVYGQDGEDLLLVKSAPKYLSISLYFAMRVDIFRGRDGQLIHTFPFSPVEMIPSIADPIMGHNMFVWRSFDLATHTSEYDVHAYLPFSCAGSSFSISPAMVVCGPVDSAVSWEDIDPVNMVAVGSLIHHHGYSDKLEAVCSRIEPLTDAFLHAVVAREVQRMFPDELGALGQWFIREADFRPITVPSGPGGAREGQSAMGCGTHNCMGSRFVGDGRFVLRSHAAGLFQLLDFSPSSHIAEDV
ncbi:hypothetical protein BJY01DRAFT_251574 [Aspergillus pseudoustus]|uniref:F-box domain-containing protein n=1 Tax=Aspergillus pseudoustus TaxID=1810923 RepID=A0ABR4JDT1_9EURO